MKNFMNSNKLFVVLARNKNSIFETLNIFADSFIDEIITKCLHVNLCGLLMLQKVFMLNFCWIEILCLFFWEFQKFSIDELNIEKIILVKIERFKT